MTMISLCSYDKHVAKIISSIFLLLLSIYVNELRVLFEILFPTYTDFASARRA